MSPREDRGREGPPQRMAETNPPAYPSGDYSYVLEIVMRMQDTLGQLKEAVGSLKEQSKHHGDKLDQIGKDVHAAKIAVGVATAIIVGVFGLIGWIVTTYISAHPAH